MRGVFCLFTSILSVFFVFHRKDLVLLNQIRRYLTSASEKYLKSIVDLTKVSDLSSKLFIQCNTGICCVHVTRDSVNIYLCQSIGPCVSCLCLSVCVISNQSTSKNQVIHVTLSVNLIPCCMKHTARGC